MNAEGRRASPHTHGDGDRAAALPRLHRQERADPAPRLAPRRDGGPDSGLGADPRGDHGHRRRLPASVARIRSSRRSGDAMTVVAWVGALTALLRGHASRSSSSTSNGCWRTRTVSQLGYMFLGLWRRRVPGRGLHGDRARLLQGHALPRRRLGDPRQRRQPGHAHDGRAAQVHAVHRVRDSSSPGSRSRASHRSPASGPRTRSSRDAASSPTTTASGSSAVAAAAFTALLHDPRDAAHLLRQRAVPRRARRRRRSADARPSDRGAHATRSHRSRRRSTTARRPRRRPLDRGSARDAVDDGGAVVGPRRARRGHRLHRPAVPELRVPHRVARPGLPRRAPSTRPTRSSKARRSTCSR